MYEKSSLVSFRLWTSSFDRYFEWYVNWVGKRNLAGLCVMIMRNDSLLGLFYFIFSPDRCILPFKKKSGFFWQLRSSLTNAILFFLKTSSDWWLGLYCYEAQPCQMSLSNSRKPRCRRIPVQSKLSLGFHPTAQHIALVLWQAFLSTALYGSPNETSDTDVFPLLMRSCPHVYY